VSAGSSAAGAAVGLALLAGLASGCGSNDAPAQGAADVSAARQFKPFALYYAGPSFEELPLTNGGGDDVEDSPRGPISFVYGTCEPEPGAETSCAPPASIQNFPICKENLSRYRGRARPRMLSLRGAPVAVFSDGSGAFEKVEVFAGRTTVALWVDDVETAKRMIGELEPINGRRRGRRLPPPPRGAVEGRRPACGD
jgi:hypothetical protein